MMALPELAKSFDLHLHTNRSDGCIEPYAVLEQCAKTGLDVIALTDHDLVSGLEAGDHVVGDRTIRLIAGAEISACHEGREFHLLVYFPGQAPDEFREFCTRQVQARARRFEAAVDTLGLPGLPAPSEEAVRGERALTRLHLAQAIVDAGHAASVSDAFSKYTGDRHGNVRPIDLPMLEAIAFARSCGGITSWAHPSARDARAYVQTFADAGLHGLEAIRPRISGSDRKTLKKLAKRHGLFLTGGSDWHGWNGHQLGLFRVTRFELQGFLDALAAA